MTRHSRSHRLPSRSRNLSHSGDNVPASGGNLFAWTIFILLLSAVAIGCWIFSFYVFNHPEKPISYTILTKLKKLQPPEQFELTKAPRGDFLNAKKLWDRYQPLTDRELARTSEALLRNYLRNYNLTRDHVPYVVGTFSILDSWELTDKNLFPTGVVALAYSPTVPQVLIEQIFPSKRPVVLVLQRMLLTGLDLRLDRKTDLSALISVRRLKDSRMQFTTVPLLYGSYASTTGPGTFSLTPPEQLNVAAGLPVLDDKIIAEADEKLATHNFRAGVKSPDGKTPPPVVRNQLMRVERPELVDGSVAPPIPPASPAHTPLPPDAPVRLAIPVNGMPAGDGITQATVVGTPPETSASPSPEASPSPTADPSAGSAWPTYAPGQMPRGRLLNLSDMPELAGQNTSEGRVYLQGDFVVTASGQNRAVLRAQGATAETLNIGGRSSNTRVIVEFPPSDRPPSEGSTFARDSRRPFQITDVRKGADGQVNVYVREITRSQ